MSGIEEEIEAAILSEVVDERGKVVRGLIRDLERESPFKSGRFRGSWVLGVNEAPVFIPGPDEASYALLGDDAIDTVNKQAGPGDNIEIADRQAYSLRIADGWSSQAPSGWIDRAIARHTSVAA